MFEVIQSANELKVGTEKETKMKDVRKKGNLLQSAIHEDMNQNAKVASFSDQST